MAGASWPGYPQILIGRSNDVAYGVTSSLVDNTDLWEEELNEDETAYQVDGEWRSLQTFNETIKVRGGRTIQYEVKSTHRGPLLDFDLLAHNSEALFGLKVPDMKYNALFSLGWAGRTLKQDQSVALGMKVSHAESVKEVMEYIDDTGKEGWNGQSFNLVMADREGDIGYMMVAPVPVR